MQLIDNDNDEEPNDEELDLQMKVKFKMADRIIDDIINHQHLCYHCVPDILAMALSRHLYLVGQNDVDEVDQQLSEFSETLSDLSEPHGEDEPNTNFKISFSIQRVTGEGEKL